MDDATMEKMVTVFDGKPVTNTLVLAEGTEVQHKNIIGMVRKYVDDLEEFGTLAFQTRKSGGLPTEFAYLNEPQATLLMTYMSNSPIIRTFKKRLVLAFFEMATSAVRPNFTFNINYKLDLARLCEKQPVLGATLLQKMTGYDLSGIISDMKLKESGGQMDLPMSH